MPRKPSPASKTSLYRIKLGPDVSLVNAIKGEYLDRKTFEQREVSVGPRPALLVYGQIPKENPDWLEHVESLTNFRPECHNDTSASILAFRLTDTDDYCYALSWGMGHLAIETTRMDDGFGLRFALRRADSDQISALTTHALDTLPRTARLSVFGGAAINSFGMEEVGEVVSRLAGKVSAEGLSSDRPEGKKFITIKGADALSVPLGKDPGKILGDLAFIDRVIRTEEPAEGLEHLENTRPLRPGHPLIPELEEKFNKRVADLGPGRIALCWPAEWNEDVGEAGSYRVTGLRGDNFTVDDLELDDLLSPAAEDPDSAKLERLRKIDVQGLAEGGSVVSRKISADKWMTFECDLGEHDRYVLQRGRWYNVGGAYLEMLDVKVQRILSAKSDIVLNAWPLQDKVKKKTGKPYVGRADEGDYNKWLAKNSNSDLLCMDRKLVKSEQHPRGFEACDLLRADGTLIHVKHLEDSVSASHLFNQALVSTEALRRQRDALDAFRLKVAELSGGTRAIADDYRPQKVILAFSGGGSVEDSIFTFSKIALARLEQRLGELEVDLQIARIEQVDDIVDFS